MEKHQNDRRMEPIVRFSSPTFFYRRLRKTLVSVDRVERVL